MAGQRQRIDLESLFRLGELADYVVPFALRAVCDLGVADHLGDGARSSDELAQATGAHAPSLQRVLRALACRGIFTEVESGRFALTPMAALLQSDDELGLRTAFTRLPGEVEAWAHFDERVRSGRSAFLDLNEQVRIGQARLDLRAALTAYDWSRLERVADLGGGDGAFLIGLLQRQPRMVGILVDQQATLEAAARAADEAAIAQRLEIVEGSLFDHVPLRADAYLLRRLLCSWSDEQVLKLLQAIRRAMRPESILLMIEPVLGTGLDTLTSLRHDVLMLATGGRPVRTRDQIDDLVRAAGFAVARMVPTPILPVFEMRPA